MTHASLPSPHGADPAQRSETLRPHRTSDGAPPTCAQLFVAFSTISVSAFGGALPWARHILVERRRWHNPDSFNEMLALCQFLPGPNIINIAISVGAGFRGLRGAAAAFIGLLLPAFCIVTVLGELYARFRSIKSLSGIFSGVAAAAAGLIVAMMLKMALPLLRDRPKTSLPFIITAFALVGIMQYPLGWVLLGLSPMSIIVAWKARS